MSAVADRRNRRILAGLSARRARELLALKESIQTGRFSLEERLWLVVDCMIDDVVRLRAREPPG